MEDELPQALLSKYKVISELGAGSSGVVYEVEEKSNNKKFAAKVIRIEIKNSKRKVKKSVESSVNSLNTLPSALRNELYYSKTLKHHNILTYIEHFITPQFLVIVTEICEKDLGKLLWENLESKEALALRSVQAIFRQAVDVLTFLHGKNLVHRDFKPDNLLLKVTRNNSDKDKPINELLNSNNFTGNIVVKLGDFGFTRALTNEKLSKPITPYVATSWYRAPEILSRERYGSPADIWALGCTLVECLIGVPLFADEHTTEAIEQFTSRQGQKAEQIWKKLDLLVSRASLDVIKKCLKFRPEDRCVAKELKVTAFYLRKRHTSPTPQSHANSTLLADVFRNFSQFSIDLYDRLLSVGRILSQNTVSLTRKRTIDDVENPSRKKKNVLKILKEDDELKDKH